MEQSPSWETERHWIHKQLPPFIEPDINYHKLQMSENKMLRGIFERERDNLSARLW
jgi:hypothetical protein